jgi:hypothetical protein
MNSHGVYFYEEETFLIDNVAHFVKQGLEQKETVIVVATAEHRTDLKTTLMADKGIGFLAPSGDYLPLDAADTLALFMVNDWPDQDLFLRVMGHIIGSARRTRIRMYGEMVALLWAKGNHLAAIQLERLWNKLAMQRDFSLLCGYPSFAFQGSDMDFAFRDVCACHSQVTGRRA